MRVLIITSEITIVPDNYHMVSLGLSDIPEVCGIMIVKNRTWTLFFYSLLGIFGKTAPALSWQIVKNFFTPSNLFRRQSYRTNNKKIWFVKDPNSQDAIDIIKSEKIDLIINSRSRIIFKSNLLEAPKIGCVNLHHGLLPEQRGQMCDFWAHLEQASCGFTLHQMTKNPDEGMILRRVEVPRSETSYLEYLDRSSLLELAMLRSFIRELSNLGTLHGAVHHLSIPFRYRKNPKAQDFELLQKRGIKV